jgi:superfamily II DNA or RNA helicase
VTTTPTLALRDYQHEALAALDAAWAKGISRAAVVIPTGGGKTVIFSAQCTRAHARNMKPLILVHRDELVRQAADKIHGAMPGASIGIVKAEHNGVDADVVVGSVQTLARERRRDQLTNVGTLIVDEAHHAAAPSYLNILRHYGAFSENGRKLPTSGWTATLVRGDEKKLGDVWEEVVYEKDILWMIDNSYLVDVRGKAITLDGLNLADVARSRGDFQEGSLGDKLLAVGAGEHIAQAYLEHAGDRQGVLFAPNVAAATAFGLDFRQAGIETELISGLTDLENRQDIYERFQKGQTQVLTNCMVLTEGWDMPQVSCAVVARPTLNAGLYTQMVGRVLRPFPGKKDALVLDVVGVAGKYKLASLTDLSKSGAEPKEGETLREARERKEKEEGRKGRTSGVIAHEDIDLFDRSRSAWLQTKAGVYFIPTRDELFFLWPQNNGKFSVGRKPGRGKGGSWVAQDMPLEYGMAWAESEAGKADPLIASRDASWRTRRQPPSPQQLDVAKMYGVPTEGLSKAQLSDRLSIFFASRSLDWVTMHDPRT